MRLDSSDTVWVDWYQLPLCSHELASCGSVTVCAVSLGVFPWPGGAQLGSCCWEILDGCQGAWLCVPEAPCLQSLQEKRCEGARTRGRFAAVEVVDFPAGAGEVAVLHGQAGSERRALALFSVLRRGAGSQLHPGVAESTTGPRLE